MTLAQRIRDFRYAKGWGPDELASRAEISRTALYQIESGKTEQPRAATVRRIAEALSIPTETLLGQAGGLGTVSVAWSPATEHVTPRMARPTSTELREAIETLPLNSGPQAPFGQSSAWAFVSREHEVERKFQELLHSPLGEGLARVVEETYRLLPGRHEAVR